MGLFCGRLSNSVDQLYRRSGADTFSLEIDRPCDRGYPADRRPRDLAWDRDAWRAQVWYFGLYSYLSVDRLDGQFV